MKGGSVFKGILMDMAHQWCAELNGSYSSDWHFTATGDNIYCYWVVNTNTVQTNIVNNIAT